MRNIIKVYLGMDVHEQSIALACYIDFELAPRFQKTIVNSKEAIKKEFEKISALGEIHCCYEAGFSGYHLYRYINSLGYDCKVIAPSLIPQKAGDKVKNDKRDAKKLSELLRANLLTMVNVPSVEAEQDRALIRLRGQIRKDLIRAKHRITKSLSLKGLSFNGTNWTLAHRQYLKNLKLEGLEKIVLDEYLTNLSYLESRLKDIEAEIKKLAFTDKYKTKVNALNCFRGISTLTSMTLLTEIKQIQNSPDKLMSYFGLTPSEHSSGQNTYKGKITKQGNARLRHIIIEAAWHYVRSPKISPAQTKKFAGQDKEITLIAIKALKRLNKRFYNLAVRKDRNVAIVAVARELVGFIWAAMVKIEGKYI